MKDFVYAIYPAADAAHSKAEILAGTGAAYNGTARVADGVLSKFYTQGLEPGTEFRTHYYAKDVDTGSESNVAVSAPYTTMSLQSKDGVAMIDRIIRVDANGLAHSQDNEYGTSVDTGLKISVLKGVLNSSVSHITLEGGTASLILNDKEFSKNYVNNLAGSTLKGDFSSEITNNVFTICIRMRPFAVDTAFEIMCNPVANNRLNISGLNDRMQITLNGAVTNVPFAGTLGTQFIEAGKDQIITFQYNDGEARCCLGDTSNLPAAWTTVAAPGTSMSFTKFAQSTVGTAIKPLDRFDYLDMFPSVDVAEAQNSHDYYFKSILTPTAEPGAATLSLPLPKNPLPANGRFNDIDVFDNSFGSLVRMSKCLQIKNLGFYVFGRTISENLKGIIIIIDESDGTYYGPVELPTFFLESDPIGEKTDVHLHPSIFKWGDRIGAWFNYPHYGYGHITLSGSNYNIQNTAVMQMGRGIRGKGLIGKEAGILDGLQYEHTHVIGDILYNVCSVKANPNNSPNAGIMLIKTQNLGKSIENWWVFLDETTTATGNWYYFGSCHNSGTGKIILDIIQTDNSVTGVDGSSDTYIRVLPCYIDLATDDKVVRAIGGSIIKTVKTATENPFLTKSEYEAAVPAFLDNGSTNVHIKITGTRINSDDSAYSCLLKNDGIQLARTPDIKTTAYSYYPVTTSYAVNADGRSTEAWPFQDPTDVTGMTYTIYCIATIGGFDVPVSIKTTDGGTTWTDEGILTGVDETKNYNRIAIQDNAEEANYVRVISCENVVNRDGHPWISPFKIKG